MPFRLRNAPAIFQRLMDRFLSDVMYCSRVYIDDIIVFSTSWEYHRAKLVLSWRSWEMLAWLYHLLNVGRVWAPIRISNFIVLMGSASQMKVEAINSFPSLKQSLRYAPSWSSLDIIIFSFPTMLHSPITSLKLLENLSLTVLAGMIILIMNFF